MPEAATAPAEARPLRREAALAAAFVLLGVGGEALGRLSFRIPGHRSFPEALVLLAAGFAVSRAPLRAAAAAAIGLTAGLAGIGEQTAAILAGAWLAGWAFLEAGLRIPIPKWALACLGGAAIGAVRGAVVGIGAHSGRPAAARIAAHATWGMAAGLCVAGAGFLRRRPRPPVESSS